MQDYALKLRHIEKFKEILVNYAPSKQLLGLLKKEKFVLLVAPTAAGRNTIIKNLVNNRQYHYVISDTTRPPRINNGQAEKSGVEYWFKTEEEFLSELKKGRYLEAAIIHDQQVSGINMGELLRSINSKKTAITDIDIKGCNTIQKYSNTVVPIFILPPEYKEWIYRLDGRGKMTDVEKNRRLRSAYHEIKNALDTPYFKFVTNRDLQETTNTINSYISDLNFNLPDQAKEKNHAQELLKELKKVL
jgi:guanylate kinase